MADRDEQGATGLRLVASDQRSHWARCGAWWCTWEDRAPTRDAARALWRAHKRECSPPLYEDRWPWRGKATKSQTEILRMVERGELLGSLCLVHDLRKPGGSSVDVLAMLGDRSGAMYSFSSWQWQPITLPGRLCRFLPGLLAAGKVLEPLVVAPRGGVRGVYRLEGGGGNV